MQWRIQDFPQGGAPTPKSAIIFQFFTEKCMKMKEFGPPGVRSANAVSNCTTTNDTVCSRCKPDLIQSEDLGQCMRCGPCCSNSTVDGGCSGDSAIGCIYDPGCTGIEETGDTSQLLRPGERF